MLRILVFSALGILVAILLFLWLLRRIRYRIGSRHVKVIFFGLTIRRIALESIDSVSKRRGEGLAEHWWNTTHPKHRMLVLRRRRGLCRNFVITPKNRYVFKTDLERAMQRAAGRAHASGDQPDDANLGAAEDARVPEPSTEGTATVEHARGMTNNE
jgi:hypothetical protein